MKKLIMMACTMAMVLAAPIAANAATMTIPKANFYSNVLFIAKNNAGDTGRYGKCDNDIYTPGHNCSGYAFFSYNSVTQKGGSSSDPDIYSGCRFDSCGCGYDTYVSGNNCVSCSSVSGWDGAVAAQSINAIHSNTSCMQCLPTLIRVNHGSNPPSCYCPDNAHHCSPIDAFCDDGYYKTTNSSTSRYECTACEDGAKTNKTGATSHTECCYDAGSTGEDNIGLWKYISKCCYTN